MFARTLYAHIAGKWKILGLLLLATWTFSSNAYAVNQIKTDHFYIYYRPEAEGTARRIAEIAEEVFDPLASVFQYYDDFAMIHVLVDDNSDLANGWANYYQNKLFIYSTALDFELRGTSDWLRNVFTHELTHILSLKKARKKWFFNFGLIQTERFNENPDFVLEVPFYHLAVPMWFAEGIAQFEAERFGSDRWDTHRDMLLRMATLEDDLLSYDDMGIFSKDGLHSEMVYNQGYDLTRYIGETYGEGAVEEMVEHTGVLNFDASIGNVLDTSGEDLYTNWKQALEARYGEVLRRIEPALNEGERIVDEGYLDYYPIYSPDGTKIAYLSNEGGDYALTQLKMQDLEDGKSRTIAEYVDNRFSWSPDGRKLVYTKLKGGKYELFIYDVEQEVERRISAGLRAKDPAFSPDGDKIVFVRNQDGTNNLARVNANGSHIQTLTNHNDGTQYYGPKWSPDGNRILFSVFRGEDRDIAVIDADSSPFSKKLAEVDSAAFPDSVAYPEDAHFEVLLHTTADERDPWWLSDGSGILFSSDRDGVFNIYEYRFATGEVRKVSEVLGGAFCPSVSPGGDEIVYAGYHAADYSIYRLPFRASGSRVALTQLDRDYRGIFSGKSLSEEYDVGPYTRKRSIMGIYPILSLGPTLVGNRFGLDQLSLGLQGGVGDVLASNQIFGGVSIGKNLKKNTDLNTDFLLMYEKRLAPVLSETEVFQPSLYAGARRRTVNNVFDRGVIFVRADTATGTIIVPADTVQYIIPNAIQHLQEIVTREDRYKNSFDLFFAGSDVRLSRRQTLTVEYLHRKYTESLGVESVLYDSSRVYSVSADGDTLEITETLRDFAGDDYTDHLTLFDDYYYENLSYFKSDDLLLLWRYSRVKPTLDRYINPAGRGIMLGYRRINATVTDSLFERQPTDGTPEDVYGPANRSLGLNEYLLSWTELVGLPGRHTLGFWLLGQYRDMQVKRSADNGGVGEGAFYWPLTFYMGGENFLSGYPYWTLAGSKRVYARLSYTFPVFQNIKYAGFLPWPLFLNYHLDRLYGVLFAETGAMWNFEEFDRKHFSARDFLTDVGLEIRLQMFGFYRIPMMAYFQIAWPVGHGRHRKIYDSDINRDVGIDAHRIYFGVRMF